MPGVTVKSNLKLMFFLSAVIFGLMTALSIGVLHAQKDPKISIPFSIFFFLTGLLPFFSWKRAFRRQMVLSSKGVSLQLAPGKETFYPWDQVHAVGMGTHATLYLKDSRRYTIFWSSIGIPECMEGYPVYRVMAPQITSRNPRMWVTPLIILGLLLIASESRVKLSLEMRFLLSGVFSIALIFRAGKFLRNYLFRS